MRGAVAFGRIQNGTWPATLMKWPMTQRFVEAIKRYAERNRIDIVSFRRGERKDERTREYLRTWTGGDGVLYIGRAQEKARVLVHTWACRSTSVHCANRTSPGRADGGRVVRSMRASRPARTARTSADRPDDHRHSSGVRPDRTRPTICCRNAAG